MRFCCEQPACRSYNFETKRCNPEDSKDLSKHANTCIKHTTLKHIMHQSVLKRQDNLA